MKQLNRYGLLRLQYLKSFHPRILQELQNLDSLENHLLDFQRQVELEIEQLVFAGMEDHEAERHVIEEYLAAS